MRRGRSPARRQSARWQSWQPPRTSGAAGFAPPQPMSTSPGAGRCQEQPTSQPLAASPGSVAGAVRPWVPKGTSSTRRWGTAALDTSRFSGLWVHSTDLPAQQPAVEATSCGAQLRPAVPEPDRLREHGGTSRAWHELLEEGDREVLDLGVGPDGVGGEQDPAIAPGVNQIESEPSHQGDPPASHARRLPVGLRPREVEPLVCDPVSVGRGIDGLSRKVARSPLSWILAVVQQHGDSATPRRLRCGHVQHSRKRSPATGGGRRKCGPRTCLALRPARAARTLPPSQPGAMMRLAGAITQGAHAFRCLHPHRAGAGAADYSCSSRWPSSRSAWFRPRTRRRLRTPTPSRSSSSRTRRTTRTRNRTAYLNEQMDWIVSSKRSAEHQVRRPPRRPRQRVPRTRRNGDHLERHEEARRRWHPELGDSGQSRLRQHDPRRSPSTTRYFPVSRYAQASWNSPTASYGGYLGAEPVRRRWRRPAEHGQLLAALSRWARLPHPRPRVRGVRRMRWTGRTRCSRPIRIAS